MVRESPKDSGGAALRTMGGGGGGEGGDNEGGNNKGTALRTIEGTALRAMGELYIHHTHGCMHAYCDGVMDYHQPAHTVQ